MGQRDSEHRGIEPTGAMDSAVELRRLPLLPYERQLIEFLGCSEDEYRYFVSEVQKKTNERPAEYALVPDIQNGPALIPALVSLAIGLVSTGISYLLAPKPQTPEQTNIRQRTLGSQRGRQRFNATVGFDGVQELAEYGSRLAILFGEYQEHGFGVTGGIMAQPQLVWSRTMSYGTHQALRLMYVLGETIGSGQKRPDLSGIFIGNNGLDLLDPSRYAFYYKPGITASGDISGRIYANNLLYGSKGTASSGDPVSFNDVFTCPTSFGPDSPGFCQTYKPSNATAFGLFNPIKNGTAFRLNWRVISRPKVSGDPSGRIREERKKVAGPQAAAGDAGMPGVGAGYSPCMGLVAHNGVRPTVPTEVICAVNDTVEFYIDSRNFQRADLRIEAASGVDMADVNNALHTAREAADSVLQIGTQIMIGNCLFKVESRTTEIYVPRKQDVRVTLRCTETVGTQHTIGIAGDLAVVRNTLTSRGGGQNAEITPNNPDDGYCGPSFWPVTQVAIASIRNTRPVDATEIGIRSVVWNRASGLCNFQNVPRAPKLLEFDNDDTNLTNGTLDKYMARSSAFAVEVRPADPQTDGTPYPWSRIEEQFVVTGSRPIDQYNFIRLKPQGDTGGRQMEYRFVPRPGALLAKYTQPTGRWVRLTGRLTGTGYSSGFSNAYPTTYGTIQLTCSGEEVLAGEYFNNKEMVTGATDGYTTVTESLPNAIGIISYYNGNGSGQGQQGGYAYEVLGNPGNYADGTRVNQRVTITKADGSKITIVFGATKRTNTDPAYEARYGTTAMWDQNSVAWALSIAVPATGTWSVSENFSHNVSVTSGNVWANYGGHTQFRIDFQVTGVGTSTSVVPSQDERTFERFSQIADVSHYDELTKSHFDGPEHEVVYVNESIANINDADDEYTPNYDACTTVGLVIRSDKSVRSVEQLNIWMPKGVDCYNWFDGSTGPSNLFCDLVYYLLTDRRAGLGDVVNPDLIDNTGFTTTAAFLKANDIYFDGAIDTNRNFKDFVTELAPYNLCSFVIKNGKFTIVPAIPYNNAGAIDPDALQVSALFTDGNIIDDTFEVEYLDKDQRRDFRAVVSYRQTQKNAFPTIRTVSVRWNESASRAYPQEAIDLSLFCTHREQALKVARYLLSIRRRVDHVVRFKTNPYGLQLAPGDYIKVVTQVAPYTASRNGVISSENGAVLSADPLADGTYTVFAYRPGGNEVETISLTIAGGKATDTANWGMVYTYTDTTINQNVYMIEELTLDEDGLVSISASHTPVEGNASQVALDVITADRFLYDS